MHREDLGDRSGDRRHERWATASRVSGGDGIEGCVVQVVAAKATRPSRIYRVLGRRAHFGN